MRSLKRALATSFTVALIATPTALADTTVSELSGNTPADDAFVDALTAQGIRRERGALVATAHNVCADLKQVADSGPGLVPTWLQVMSALHVLPGQADFVIAQAKHDLCPEYS